MLQTPHLGRKAAASESSWLLLGSGLLTDACDPFSKNHIYGEFTVPVFRVHVRDSQ